MLAFDELIILELEHSERKEWVDFTPKKVDFDLCEWSVTGQYFDSRFQFGLRNISLHCAPIGAKKTSIWTREDFGRISDIDHHVWKPWTCAYDFCNMKGVIGLLNLQDDGWVFTDAEKKMFKVELRVERPPDPDRKRLQLIDLTDPNNEMIESPSDAAPVDVDGERLWLSKSKLSAASPFFNALFNSDFKEKCTGKYELKEINLDVFLRFVSIIYGLRVSIDEEFVELLLQMADYYQCDHVVNRCGNALLNEIEFTSERKLILADRYKLTELLEEVVSEMLWDDGPSELQKFVDKSDEYGFSNTTVDYMKKQLKSEGSSKCDSGDGWCFDSDCSCWW